MKANEFLDETEEIAEIVKLPARYFNGGKTFLKPFVSWQNPGPRGAKKLPGNSGLLYSIIANSITSIITLWDPNGKEYLADISTPENQPSRSTRSTRSTPRSIHYFKYTNQYPGQLIGKLELVSAGFFPLTNAVQVSSITVDEDYRGLGISKALYGIVLTIMKRPLLAGTSQTPGGRKNWVSLAKIPGVQMKGYVSLHDNDEKNINIVLNKIGGQYIGNDKYNNIMKLFAFDVKPNTTGQELEAYVKHNMSKIYNTGDRYDTGLFAVWSNK